VRRQLIVIAVAVGAAQLLVAMPATASTRVITATYYTGGAVTDTPINVEGGGFGVGTNPITGQPYSYSYSTGGLVVGTAAGENSLAIDVVDHSGLPVAVRIETTTSTTACPLNTLGQTCYTATEVCGVHDYVMPVTPGEDIGIWPEYGACTDNTPSVPTYGTITATFTTPSS
jgi:hypothetical protein